MCWVEVSQTDVISKFSNYQYLCAQLSKLFMMRNEAHRVSICHNTSKVATATLNATLFQCQGTGTRLSKECYFVQHRDPAANPFWAIAPPQNDMEGVTDWLLTFRPQVSLLHNQANPLHLQRHTVVE